MFRKHPAYRTRAVVNLPDHAVVGIVWRSRGRWLVLKDAVLQVEGSEPAKMDGDVIIEQQKVLFIQALPEG